MLDASSLGDLKDIFKRGDGELRSLFFPKLEEVRRAVESLKQLGCRVVMTSGVYDMVHEGHVKYLRKARQEGDVLILAIDTDERVRERKGPNRPVAGLDERLHVLSDFRFVDIITLVETNDDPAYVVKALHPDVLVVSETTQEMKPEVLVELAQHCGRIVHLPPQSANSTSARLRRLVIEGNIDVLRQAEKKIEEALDSVRALGDKLQAEQDSAIVQRVITKEEGK